MRMMNVKAGTFETKVSVISPVRQPQGLCIVVDDARDLLQIGQEFSGHQQLEVRSVTHDGVTIYTGYSKITSMYRNGNRVTIVLGKE